MVEAVVLRYLGLAIVMTNILQAFAFSLTKVGASSTGASVLCCSLGLFYPKLKEVVLKWVILKS